MKLLDLRGAGNTDGGSGQVAIEVPGVEHIGRVVCTALVTEEILIGLRSFRIQMSSDACCSNAMFIFCIVQL